MVRLRLAVHLRSMWSPHFAHPIRGTNDANTDTHSYFIQIRPVRDARSPLLFECHCHFLTNFLFWMCHQCFSTYFVSIKIPLPFCDRSVNGRSELDIPKFDIADPVISDSVISRSSSSPRLPTSFCFEASVRDCDPAAWLYIVFCEAQKVTRYVPNKVWVALCVTKFHPILYFIPVH